MNQARTKQTSPYRIGHKMRCEHPAYLFWKLQSQLTKLNAQLTSLQQQSKR